MTIDDTKVIGAVVMLAGGAFGLAKLYASGLKAEIKEWKDALETERKAHAADCDAAEEAALAVERERRSADVAAAKAIAELAAQNVMLREQLAQRNRA